MDECRQLEDGVLRLRERNAALNRLAEENAGLRDQLAAAADEIARRDRIIAGLRRLF